jgi:hypothetical protein
MSLLPGGNGVIPLDLRSLSSGIYMVRLDAGGLSATQKLVVNKRR